MVTGSISYGVSALNFTAKPKPPAIWAYLGGDPLDMPRTLILRAKENALNNPPCPIAPPPWTSSSVHLSSHQSNYIVT